MEKIFIVTATGIAHNEPTSLRWSQVWFDEHLASLTTFWWTLFFVTCACLLHVLYKEYRARDRHLS